MGQVITVMNMKGGVGKTTVAANVGGNLALYKHGGAYRNVLIIDYDAQFNISQSCMPVAEYRRRESAKKTIMSVLLDDPTDLDPFRLRVPGNETPPPLDSLEYVMYNQNSQSGKLAIVPSTLELMYVALGEPDKKTKPIEERFRKFITEAKNMYDVVLIDCHPAGSIFTKTALKNSQHVLIPVTPGRYSVRGIGLMMSLIDSQRIGSNGPSPHILFNRMPRVGTPTEEQTIRNNPRYKDKCLIATLKEYSAFAESVDGRGFVWHSGKPWSRQARYNLWHVTEEISQKLAI